MARLVVPNHPHHVIQRGNHRQSVFFGDDDHLAYLVLIQNACERAETAVLVYLPITSASSDSEGFVDRLDSITGRTLWPARPGPKPKVG